MSETALVRQDDNRMVAPAALPVNQVMSQVAVIQEIMHNVMKPGTHYGVIPGCGEKPTLLKPGAETLGFTFRLSPEFEIKRTDLDGGHREYEIVCTLRNINSGSVMGQGLGSCSTMESKYRWRNAERCCPECGSVVRKSKQKEEWYCWAKTGGCGATYAIDDLRITEQVVGRVENPDIADTYNTVLKMAKKRAHVDATLTALAASDIFTQDIEDMHSRMSTDVVEAEVVEPEEKQKRSRKPEPPKQAAATAPSNGRDKNFTAIGDMLKEVFGEDREKISQVMDKLYRTRDDAGNIVKYPDNWNLLKAVDPDTHAKARQICEGIVAEIKEGAPLEAIIG